MNQLHRFDTDTFRFIHLQSRQPWLDPIMSVITDTGLGHWQVLVLLCLLPFKAVRHYFAPLFLAFIVSGLLRQLPMMLIARTRPSNLSIADPIEHVFKDTSFPSGHTTTSFAIATMLMFILWNTRYAWVSWIVMLWACLVGYSRIYVGVHWPIDVVGGILFGAGSAAALFLVLKRAHRFLPDIVWEKS